MHRRARLVFLEGRSTDPVDCQRALLSGSGPGRPGGRPTKSFCSLYPGLGRPVDGTTVKNLTVVRSTDSRKSAELSPTASFWRPVYWGCFGLFSTRFEVSFQVNFSYLSKCLSPLVLELNFHIKRRVFQEYFVKEIS